MSSNTDEAQGQHAEQAAETTLSPSEALYRFVAWLTNREQSMTLGARHDSAEVRWMVAEFCQRHKLPKPRADYASLLYKGIQPCLECGGIGYLLVGAQGRVTPEELGSIAAMVAGELINCPSCRGSEGR